MRVFLFARRGSMGRCFRPSLCRFEQSSCLPAARDRSSSNRFGRVLGPGSLSAVRHYSKLAARGLVEDVFPDRPDLLQDLMNSSSQCVYAGFDPTADSLHVGNLLVLIGLLHFQRAGHQPLVVIGGATAVLGDPSGRRRQRAPLESEQAGLNAGALEALVRRVFDNHERHLWTDRERVLPPLRVLNNAEWYGQYSLVDFLTIVGRRFRMSEMLSRCSVQSRLSSADGMNFSEFCYQVLQAYDWLYLWRKHECRLQLGGSDQRGNMLSGYELITGTSDFPNTPLYGISMPLVTSQEGDKLGKSAGNAIWLSAERTSPFDLYQFLVRTADADVGRLLRLLTFLPLAEVERLERQHRLDPGSRAAQKRLAEQVTLLVHGRDGVQTAARLTEALYSRDPAAIARLELHELRDMFKHSPLTKLMLTSGMTCRDLGLAAKCFSTPFDADRIITGGGFRINDIQLTNPDQLILADQHVLACGLTLLRTGKKNYYVVEWV